MKRRKFCGPGFILNSQVKRNLQQYSKKILYVVHVLGASCTGTPRRVDRSTPATETEVKYTIL